MSGPLASILISLTAGLVVAAGAVRCRPPGAGRLRKLRAEAPAVNAPSADEGESDSDSDRHGLRGTGVGRFVDLLFGAIEPAESELEILSFDLELTAICLQAGLSPDRALALAAQASGDRSGLSRLARSLELGTVGEAQPGHSQVVALIEFSRTTGVALAPLMKGLAHDMRRAERRRRSLAAAKLGVQLVIPLGVCILPSFVLLGVVPVLLTLIADISRVFH